MIAWLTERLRKVVAARGGTPPPAPSGPPPDASPPPARGARAWPHVALPLALLGLNVAGVGYRSLWADEMETAERARTILESGYPRVVDASGAISVNSGGLEIEEGVVHRYSPWGQFYVGALGLGAGRLLGLSPDGALRLPFVAAHAAAGGLASWALTATSAVPLPLGLLAGAAISTQTARLLHGRSARYHAALDLLAVLGAVAIGAVRRSRPWGRVLLAGTLLVLPHFHTFGGSVVALALGAWATWAFLSIPGRRWAERLRAWAGWVVAPGAVSLLLLVWLVRPLDHGFWVPANVAVPPFSWTLFFTLGTLGNRPHLLYALAAVLAGLALLLAHRRWTAAAALGASLLVVSAAVQALDFHNYSQYRYYLSLPLLALCWPIALGSERFGVAARGALGLVLSLTALAPDLWFANRPGAPFPPFQGLRIAVSDARHALAGTRQPLHEAVDFLHGNAAPGDPIAFDLTPQYVTWYLPGHPPALVPDATARTPLNRENPVWRRPLLFPRWHVWYLDHPNGPWNCSGACDWRAERLDRRTGAYVLRSGRLARAEEMCIVAAWPTHHHNNAPFTSYSPEALDPAGPRSNVLVIGTPCVPPATP